jgi:hypothetical protein
MGTKMSAVAPDQPDHIILGCRCLDEGIAYVEKRSGCRAAFGGSHPGRGTCNALLKMGSHSYLEILALDPEQKELAWHEDIATLSEPLLVGYAIRLKNLDQLAATLQQKGINCHGPIAGCRIRPDGQVLRWHTLSYADDKSGLLPFFIDWDEHSIHPATDAPGSLSLISFVQTGHLLEGSVAPSGHHKALNSKEPAQLRALLAGKFGEFELLSKAIPSEAWSAS